MVLTVIVTPAEVWMVVGSTFGTVSLVPLSAKAKLGATEAFTVTWSWLASVPKIYTGVVVESIVVPPLLSLSTMALYWPAVAGFWILPVGMIKPYRVVASRLAEVSPDTTIVPPSPAPELVTTDVRAPGGAVILAGVDGKPVVATVGVPAVRVKPVGKVIFILLTLVGVVFSLKVTSRSLAVLALMPSRPKRKPPCVKLVALAIAGITKAATITRATTKKDIFLDMSIRASVTTVFSPKLT